MMAARDLITFDELEAQLRQTRLDGLDNRRGPHEDRSEALQNTSERVERLRLMQQNPILTLMGQTEDMRQDYCNDLELRVEKDKGT
jgi:hypothetical protein